MLRRDSEVWGCEVACPEVVCFAAATSTLTARSNCSGEGAERLAELACACDAGGPRLGNAELPAAGALEAAVRDDVQRAAEPPVASVARGPRLAGARAQEPYLLVAITRESRHVDATETVHGVVA